jgi:hypothetical protein
MIHDHYINYQNFKQNPKNHRPKKQNSPNLQLKKSLLFLKIKSTIKKISFKM